MAKLLLLTTEPENWAPKQLIKVAKEKGFDTEIINPQDCYINLSNDPYISYKGTKFLSADICIPRLSEDQMDYKIAIIDHIEKMGIKVINKGAALKTASNKIETQIKLNAVRIKNS